MVEHLNLVAPERPRILIVDDDIGIVRVLGEVLKDEGEVFFCTDGEQAFETARGRRPDLILLDVEMPGANGFQVCAALRGDPATNESCVIFVTSHSDAGHETRGLEAGAVDFITKPINPGVVRARVRTHLTLKRQTDVLRRLAFIDGLTGIANRRTFDDVLAREWRRAWRAGTPLSVAMVDVDFFKRYNDLYGHLDGDTCLQAVARVLGSSMRRSGDLAARYGGEEFAIVLPGTDEAGAFVFGDLLCRRVQALGIRHEGSDAAASVTISVGVATVVPNEVCRPDHLVDAADHALYEAKTEGRNQARAAAVEC